MEGRSSTLVASPPETDTDASARTSSIRGCAIQSANFTGSCEIPACIEDKELSSQDIIHGRKGNGDFEPELMKKYQRDISGIEDRIPHWNKILAQLSIHFGEGNGRLLLPCLWYAILDWERKWAIHVCR